MPKEDVNYQHYQIRKQENGYDFSYEIPSDENRTTYYQNADKKDERLIIFTDRGFGYVLETEQSFVSYRSIAL